MSDNLTLDLDTDTDLDTSLDLADFEYVSMADVDADGYQASFRLYYHGYNSTREEVEHETNAKFILAAITEADAGAGHVVCDDGCDVTVTVRDDSGAYTAAYRKLYELHEQLADYPVLDDAAHQSAIEDAADDHVDYHLDEAREIVEGGEAAFKADEWCQTYGGDWDSLGDDTEARVGELAWRMAYQAIDEG